MAGNIDWTEWDGNEMVGYYSLDYALYLARLWKAGKMIGGDVEQVMFALLREVERLSAGKEGGDAK